MIAATTTRRLLSVWLGLVAATALSWLVGRHHGIGTDGSRVGTAIALGVAFVKVHVIGSEFMELRAAPLALRLAFGGWILVVGGTLIGLYVLG